MPHNTALYTIHHHTTSLILLTINRVQNHQCFLPEFFFLETQQQLKGAISATPTAPDHAEFTRTFGSWTGIVRSASSSNTRMNRKVLHEKQVVCKFQVWLRRNSMEVHAYAVYPIAYGTYPQQYYCESDF